MTGSLHLRKCPPNTQTWVTTVCLLFFRGLTALHGAGASPVASTGARALPLETATMLLSAERVCVFSSPVTAEHRAHSLHRLMSLPWFVLRCQQLCSQFFYQVNANTDMVRRANSVLILLWKQGWLYGPLQRVSGKSPRTVHWGLWSVVTPRTRLALLASLISRIIGSYRDDPPSV